MSEHHHTWKLQLAALFLFIGGEGWPRYNLVRENHWLLLRQLLTCRKGRFNCDEVNLCAAASAG